MKSIVLSVFVYLALAGSLFAQEEQIARKVTKEVELLDENGVKKLIIRTNDNGKLTEEVFTGEEADKKLAELNAEMPIEQEKQDIRVEILNGKKTLTIRSTKDGITSEEVFEGEKADQKMKELGIEDPEPKLVPKVIKKEQPTYEKSNM